jgi:hypothetical protein
MEQDKKMYRLFHVTSKKIDHNAPERTYSISGIIELNREDVEWEDTIPVPVTLPRAAWKIIQACCEQNEQNPSDVISDFVNEQVAKFIGYREGL